MNMSLRAMRLAEYAHRNQKRKYTNEPYFVHLAQVAGIVSASPLYASPETLAIAWLHDTLEDTNLRYTDILFKFGAEVAEGVKLLTDNETGNRKTRKRLAAERLSAAPANIQTIKCADLISNMMSIETHDPKFAVVYIEECRMLLNVLDKADADLWAMAKRYIVP